MSNNTKNTLRKVMKLAWQFIRKNGFTLSEALKTAWANVKLGVAMAKGIVKFYFQKVDGTRREAYGTTNLNRIPSEYHPKGESKNIPTLQVYFDTEKNAWRSFKKANLVY